MAKRKRSYSGVRRVRTKARRMGARFGTSGLVKAAMSGAVLAVGYKVGSMIPFGLSATIKRYLTIGIMYLLGGVFRQASYVGVALEVLGLASGMLSGISVGSALTASGSPF